MTTAEYKLAIIEKILSVDNERTAVHLFELVDTFLKELSGENTEETEQEPAAYQTFEEWNEQFTDSRDLNEHMPEYGMTLREFRMGIYEAEMDTEGDMTVDELLDDIDKW